MEFDTWLKNQMTSEGYPDTMLSNEPLKGALEKQFPVDARTAGKRHVWIRPFPFNEYSLDFVVDSETTVVELLNAWAGHIRAMVFGEELAAIISLNFETNENGDALPPMPEFVLTTTSNGNLILDPKVKLWMRGLNAKLRIGESMGELCKCEINNTVVIDFVVLITPNARDESAITIPAKEEVIVRQSAKRKRDNVFAHQKALPKDDPKLRGKKLSANQKAVQLFT